MPDSSLASANVYSVRSSCSLSCNALTRRQLSFQRIAQFFDKIIGGQVSKAGRPEHHAAVDRADPAGVLQQVPDLQPPRLSRHVQGAIRGRILETARRRDLLSVNCQEACGRLQRARRRHPASDRSLDAEHGRNIGAEGQLERQGLPQALGLDRVGLLRGSAILGFFTRLVKTTWLMCFRASALLSVRIFGCAGQVLRVMGAGSDALLRGTRNDQYTVIKTLSECTPLL